MAHPHPRPTIPHLSTHIQRIHLLYPHPTVARSTTNLLVGDKFLHSRHLTIIEGYHFILPSFNVKQDAPALFGDCGDVCCSFWAGREASYQKILYPLAELFLKVEEGDFGQF